MIIPINRNNSKDDRKKQWNVNSNVFISDNDANEAFSQ